jgi:hypothetical protein
MVKCEEAMMAQHIVTIDPDRLFNVRMGYPPDIARGQSVTLHLQDIIVGCLEDIDTVTPAFVVTIRGEHTDKHDRIGVTENGALKVVRIF